MTSLLVGLFVGGRGARLGGVAKGNLQTRDHVRLIVRLVAVCREALPEAELVLVGAGEPYADLGLSALPDDPPHVGPLGGFRALLLEAETHHVPSVIALACDMPFVTATLLRRLATEYPGVAALAPREAELWQPLAARYAVSAVLEAVDAALAARERALQRIFARLGERAAELPLTEPERGELRDCDSEDDLTALGLTRGS